ncbi:MAG TPA: ankyrin repeat domain-containing protein [Chromatiales bacterium]|nr:ankyrin repeat domain-containing protein [Chromatiales bacterium]
MTGRKTTIVVALVAFLATGMATAGALHDALISGKHGKAMALIKKSKPKSLNRPNVNGFTPLQLAVMYGREKEAALLIKRGVKVNKRDSEGMTALHVAAGNAGTKLSMFKLLLNKGAKVNAKDNYGRTPLHLMARAGKAKAARLLIKHGAKTGIKDKRGNTPLKLAKAGKNAPLIDALKERKSNKRRIADNSTPSFLDL